MYLVRSRRGPRGKSQRGGSKRRGERPWRRQGRRSFRSLRARRSGRHFLRNFNDFVSLARKFIPRTDTDRRRLQDVSSAPSFFSP